MTKSSLDLTPPITLLTRWRLAVYLVLLLLAATLIQIARTRPSEPVRSYPPSSSSSFDD